MLSNHQYQNLFIKDFFFLIYQFQIHLSFFFLILLFPLKFLNHLILCLSLFLISLLTSSFLLFPFMKVILFIIQIIFISFRPMLFIHQSDLINFDSYSIYKTILHYFMRVTKSYFSL